MNKRLGEWRNAAAVATAAALIVGGVNVSFAAQATTGSPGKTGFMRAPIAYAAHFQAKGVRTHAGTRSLLSGQQAVPQSSGNPAGLTWNWANPRPTGGPSHGVAFGNGVYVVVGNDGSIMSSSDGQTWTIRASSPVNTTLMRVIYANGQFVVLGEDAGSNGVILTSPDGSTWTAATLTTVPVQGSFYLGLVYGNGTYLATGFSGGVVLSSSDGKTWTAQTVATGIVGTYAPVFGAGKFALIAVDSSSAAFEYYSNDGVTWTKGTVNGTSSTTWYSIAWNGSSFVIVGTESSCSTTACGAVFTSPDGITFTQQTDAGSNDGFTQPVAMQNGTFYTFSYDTATSTNDSFSSSDGINWTNLGAAQGGFPYLNVASTGTGFIGDTGYSTFAFSASPDFINWTAQSLAVGPTADLNNVAYLDGQFVAAGNNEIRTSPDGINWTTAYTDTTGTVGTLFASIWGNGLFVAVGWDSGHTKGEVLTSSDGQSWSLSANPPAAGLDAISYGNGQFVATGHSGAVYTSPDGQAWTAQTSGTQENLSSAVWTGERFVVAGDIDPTQGETAPLFVSTDGKTWIAANVPNVNNDIPGINDVRRAGTQWIAVGYLLDTTGAFVGPYLATSPDGVTWTAQPSLASTDSGFAQHGISDIVFENGQYLVLGGLFPTLYSSSDLQNWTKATAFPSDFISMNSLLLGGNQLVVAGASGEIVYATVSGTLPGATNGTLIAGEGVAVTGTLAGTPSTAGDSLNFSIVTQPAHGSVTLTDATTGAYTYTPTAGYTGADSFTFNVTDSQTGLSCASAGMVTVTVDAAPQATAELLSVNENSSGTGLLAASYPVDGMNHTGTFTIASQPAHGAVTLTTATGIGGAYSYTPTSGYSGSDSFTYTVQDSVTGLVSAPATVSITVNAASSGGSGGSGSSGGGGGLGLLGLLALAAVGGLRRRRMD